MKLPPAEKMVILANKVLIEAWLIGAFKKVSDNTEWLVFEAIGDEGNGVVYIKPVTDFPQRAKPGPTMSKDGPG